MYFSGGELFAYDSAGNSTQISPHDSETGEWIFYSKNTKTGKVLRVDMEKLVKFIGNRNLITVFIHRRCWLKTKYISWTCKVLCMFLQLRKNLSHWENHPLEKNAWQHRHSPMAKFISGGIKIYLVLGTDWKQ